MKRLVFLSLALMMTMSLTLPTLVEGARIGALTCIGMTEDDVKQWTADVAAAEGKDTPYKSNSRKPRRLCNG